MINYYATRDLCILGRIYHDHVKAMVEKGRRVIKNLYGGKEFDRARELYHQGLVDFDGSVCSITDKGRHVANQFLHEST